MPSSRKIKRKGRYAWLWYIAALVVLWICVCEILWRVYDGRNGSSFVAASSLFAALAISITAYALNQQQRDRLKATTLDVFIHIFDKMLKDENLKAAQKYVRESLYSDLTKMNPQHNSKNPRSVTQSVSMFKKKRKKFVQITYVCDNIEYLGILVRHGYIDIQFVVDYWGEIIKDTFEKLKPFIDKERETTPNFCRNYQYLYEHIGD